MANRVKMTAEKKEQFAQLLVQYWGNVSRTCRACGISKNLAYEHRRDDPEFRQMWDEALEEGIEILEEKCHQRATDESDPSDTLAIFLLKGHRPLKYRERISTEISGPAGGPIHVKADSLTDDQLAEIAGQGETDAET